MATIPGVSNNELIRTTWGNSVATELNSNTVKIAGSTMTGTLIINPGTGAAMRLRRSTNDPYFQFEHSSGSPRYGYILASATGMNFLVDAGTFRWINAAGTEFMELGSGLLRVTGQARFGNDAAPQLVIADTAAARECRMYFYGNATDVDTLGTLSGSIGYFGDTTMLLNNDIGGVTLSADTGDSIRCLVAGTECMEVSANLVRVTGVGRFFTSAAPQVILAGPTGEGCRMSFYANATNVDTLGTISAYVGVMEDGTFEISQGSSEGMAFRSSTGGNYNFWVGSDHVMAMTNQLVLVGKTVASAGSDNTGIILYGSGSATVQQGQVRTTTGTAGQCNIYLRHMGTADANDEDFVLFTRTTSGTQIGAIEQNGTTGVTYGTTSDYRIKNVLGDVVDPLGRVNQLRPWHLEWKDQSGEFDGFLAHEVAEVVPGAVTGEKDAVLPPEHEFNPGGIDPQQLDYGKLVPLLTAALQEASNKIDELTARVAALEGAAS